MPSAASAQAGERDVVVTRDADYFGRDYEILKNVDLDIPRGQLVVMTGPRS